MAAALITPEQISAGLSGGEGVDEENREAVGMAALMLRECLRNYSAAYNKARAERLKAMEAAPEQREG